MRCTKVSEGLLTDSKGNIEINCWLWCKISKMKFKIFFSKSLDGCLKVVVCLSAKFCTILIVIKARVYCDNYTEMGHK